MIQGKIMRRSVCAWGLIGLFYSGLALTADPADSDLPGYQATEGLAGRIASIGSDTLAPAMKLWVRKFLYYQPKIVVSVRSGGSSTAPPALTAGTAQLGPMSRAIKPAEQAAFREAHGYDPTAIQVAFDALTIYVHQDNPLEKLTIPQIDAIFSTDLRCGYPQPIDNWGEAGLSGTWTDKPITLIGRTPASGTYGFFEKKALCKGRYRESINGRRSNTTLVQKIIIDEAAIGYAGIKYQQMVRVKGLLLAKDGDSEFVAANVENALSGDYPLVRPLYIYVDKKPGHPVAPLVGAFLRMVLSSAGQAQVKKSGYIPLPADRVSQELAKLK